MFLKNRDFPRCISVLIEIRRRKKKKKKRIINDFQPMSARYYYFLLRCDWLCVLADVGREILSKE